MKQILHNVDHPLCWKFPQFANTIFVTRDKVQHNDLDLCLGKHINNQFPRCFTAKF